MRLGAKIALGSSRLGFLPDWPAQDAYTRRIGCDQSDAFEPLPLFVLVWIEPSPLGRQLEQACYKDTVLSWADSDSVLVQLVDLKNIPLVNGFTPRAPLLALLTSLEQMQPKSV